MTYSYLNYNYNYDLDIVVPSQVTGLSATAGNTQASLSWTAPSNGGSAITDYIIQYSTNGSSWSTFNDGVSTSTSTTVTGLTKNTLYYFKVAAVNIAGTGTFSSSVTATILGVPDAPTSVSVTPISSTQAELSWIAPSNNGGSTITDYIIQYSTDNSNWSLFTDGVSTSTTTVVIDLTQSTLYYFRVAATNAQGNSSYSSSTSTTTLEEKVGRKFIFTKTRNKIQVPIKVKGNMIVETAITSNVLGTMKTPIITENVTYSGKIGINESFNINGKSSYLIENSCKADGKMSQSTDIKMLVEGKKDFTKVISMLEEFLEIKTPNRNYANCTT